VNLPKACTCHKWFSKPYVVWKLVWCVQIVRFDFNFKCVLLQACHNNTSKFYFCSNFIRWWSQHHGWM